MKKFLIVLLVAMTLVGSLAAQSDFKANYKVTMTQTAQHPYAIGAYKLGELIKERTNGRITLTVFTDSQLAKGEQEMIQALQMGTIDIYVGSTGPVGNFSPSINILDIPFIFRDAAHVDKVLDGPIGTQLLDDLEKNKLKGLAFWENGFRNLTNSRTAIKTPDQAKGLKLRTMENKIHMAAFKAAGISPTPMAWAEVYSALQQKVIDAEENPIAVIYASKLWEVQKYLSLTGHVYSPAPVIFSLVKWNKIPKADQEIIAQAAKEVAPFQRKTNRDAEDSKVNEMESKGMVIVRDVNKAAWQAAMQPAFADFEKQFGKEKIDAIINTK